MEEEKDLMQKIAEREAFAKEYGPETIDADELESLRGELASVKNELNLSGKVGYLIVEEIEAKFDELMVLIGDSDEKPHHYIYPFPPERAV